MSEATVQGNTHTERSDERYAVHPYLDPRLPSRHPSLARLWLSAYHRALKDPDAYSRMLRSYSTPLHKEGDPAKILDRYFHDADIYLDDLLRLVPQNMAEQMRPTGDIRKANDILRLLRLTFDGPDERSRYEAQRKLYLTKLLFDVDHCRNVRDGLRHKKRFETFLDEQLWANVAPGREVEVCCRFEKELQQGRLIIGVPPEPGTVCWRFHLRHLPRTDGDPEVDIYHYRSRFKREAIPLPGQRTENGFMTIGERPRWPGLGRRSGSIVSKMLRRGIADPSMVEDLLGAMFIVGNRRQAYALERRLIHAFGGPLRWRDRVDTLSGERDRSKLNPSSSSGFLVLKGIVDILTEDPTSSIPYNFSVEIQVYPLEAYLRTLHAADFASHYAYKRRQFLHDLLPMLFPVEIYGKETAHLAAESG